MLAHTTSHNHFSCQLTLLSTARLFQARFHERSPRIFSYRGTATSGNVTPSGPSTNTPITSFRTSSKEDIFQANITLLFEEEQD
jgi:hypothetical protein